MNVIRRKYRSNKWKELKEGVRLGGGGGLLLCLFRVKKLLQIGGSIELSVRLSHEDITVLAHPSVTPLPEDTGVRSSDMFPFFV
jgi:hypothetical protein